MANKLSRADFDYFKDEFGKDEDKKEKEYIQRIEPDRILAYYEGTREMNYDDYAEIPDEEVQRIALNKIFPATQTLAATLLPSNPGFTCIGKRNQDDYSAQVAQGSLNYYFDEGGALRADQRAVLNAWLFGFGGVKQLWRTVTKKANKPKFESTGDEPLTSGKTAPYEQPTSDVNAEYETTDEFIAKSEPVFYCPANANLYLDSRHPFGEGKRITERFSRTLHQLRTCGMYDLGDDFINKFKTQKDDRKIHLVVYEHWALDVKGTLHLLVRVEGWDKPIRYDVMPYMAEGLPYDLISLNMEPDVTYPIAHMKAAQRIHRELDYILTLQLLHIRKHKNIDIFHEAAFDQSTINMLKRNPIGGIGFTNRPIGAGAYQHIGGNTIPKDLFAMSETLLQNLKEILSVTGARISGQSEYDTATQEKIADYGNQLRSMSMTEQVNQFLKRQGRRLLQNIKQFATMPVLFQVTGLDIQDPESGQLVTEAWLEFATEQNPVMLKDAIQGEYDIDIDVTNVARRDIALIRQQMTEVTALFTNPVIVEQLAAQGYRFNMSELLKDLMKNFETIGNAAKYIEEIPKPPMMPGMMPGAMPGMEPTAGVPEVMPGAPATIPEAVPAGVM